MHIMEGYLPPMWCAFWYILSGIVIAYGIVQLRKILNEHPDAKPLVAIAGAYMFVLSSLKMPSVTGSCSHPCGNALGAVLFGVPITAVLGAIVLLFQALFLAHGGITTLGANDFSMGIVGPAAAIIAYKICMRLGLSSNIAIFFAAVFGDWFTYITTAIQLALAFPIPSFTAAFTKFIVIYAYTQVPLAIAEGFLIIIIWDYLKKLRPDILKKLNVVPEKELEPYLNVKPAVSGGE